MTTCRTLCCGWALALIVMAGFCALGTWQLGRMRLKQSMLDEVAAVLEQRAAAPWGPALARENGYDWVRGSGVFADVPALLLDNQMREGRAGVRVYRVFIPEMEEAVAKLPSPTCGRGCLEGGRGLKKAFTTVPEETGMGSRQVLVDLGWLPLPDRRALPVIERPDGPQWLEGLLAPPPRSGLAQAAPTLENNGAVLSVSLRTPGLAQLLHQPSLPARVLRLDPGLALGYARDLDILPNTMPPERHLGYAVQWYALALTVLVITLILTLRKPCR